MSMRHEPDPLQPAIRRAEAEVARHLEEACEEVGRRDLSQESLDELLRLEDELIAAARAVDETVRLRRQLGERTTTAPDSRTSTIAPAATRPAGEAPTCRLREFRDAEGREWRAWEVRPGSTGRRINPERYLGEYVKGWLAFECPGGGLRKRLPNHPPDWFGMADVDLDRLLPQAVDVAKRGPNGPGASTR
jgi:hypothetical protein